MQESITVKKTGLFHKYKKIQDAIDQLVDGGTIYVEAGVYQGNIVIQNKNITIIGRGHVVLTMNNEYSVVTVRGGQLNLKNVHVTQEGHSNAIILRKSAQVKIENCHLTGEKTAKENNLKFPVVYIDELCQAEIIQCKLISHTVETVYVKSGNVELTDCELHGFGIHGHENSTIRIENLQINHPRSYGIWSKNSKLDINHLQMDGGGVLLISEQSHGDIKHIVARSPYRDALRLINSELNFSHISIENSGKIYYDNNKDLYASIEITKDSKVHLSDVQIENPSVEGFRIEKSNVTINQLQINGGTVGISCRDNAILAFQDIHITNTEYNAIVTKEVESVHILNSKFTNCVKATGKMNYPIISMRKIEKVTLDQITITDTRHDGLLLEDITNASLKSITIEKVNLGLFLHNTIVSLEKIHFNKTLSQAIYARGATIQMQESRIHDSFINHEKTSQLYSDKTLAAMMCYQSDIKLKSVEITDASAAIFIGDKTYLQAEDLIVAGGIFVQQSSAKIRQFKRHELEKAAIPIRVGVYAQLEIDFVDPDLPVILNKDESSLFLSNLNEKPQTLVQVNFNENKQSQKVTSLFEANENHETKQPEASNVIPFQQQDENSTSQSEQLENWLKQFALAMIRLKQGIGIPKATSLMLVSSDPTQTNQEIKHLTETILEKNWLVETQIKQIQELEDMLALNTKEAYLLIINKPNLFLANDQLMPLLDAAKENWTFIMAGESSEIEAFIQKYPTIEDYLAMQVTWDKQRSLIKFQRIYESLEAKQFIFNKDDIEQVLQNHLPDHYNEWETAFIEATIKAQSERLLAEELETVSEEDFLTLIKEDFYQALNQLT